MAISSNAITNGTDAAGSGLTTVVTEAGALAGESLEVCFTVDNAVSVSTVASVPAETWTQLANLNDAAHGQRMYTYTAKNITGGSTVITATLTGPGAFRAMSSKRISGTSGYDSVAGAKASQNQDGPGVGTGANAITSGNTPARTSQPNLVSGWCYHVSGANNSTPTVGTGYSSDGTGWTFGDPNPYMRSESKVDTVTTAVAATFTDAVDGAAGSYQTAAEVFLQTAAATTFIPLVGRGPGMSMASVGGGLAG